MYFAQAIKWIQVQASVSSTHVNKLTNIHFLFCPQTKQQYLQELLEHQSWQFKTYYFLGIAIFFKQETINHIPWEPLLDQMLLIILLQQKLHFFPTNLQLIQ